MTAASTADIGVFGLAAMGSNLARNVARHDYTVALHNRTRARTDQFMAAHAQEGDVRPSAGVEEFVQSLARPRRALIMVKAGPPTDATILNLTQYLEEGDIVVDVGNAFFEDTRRREADLREKGLHFVGAGVSGGEEGALDSPSIMPGGSRESYESLGPLLETVAARYDDEPCCACMGPDGAGHFVKMVHNGIEYAAEQAIAEAYDLLRVAGLEPTAQAEAFRAWNAAELESYLVQITAELLGQVDAATGRPFVDVVVDAAGEKGTGRWTARSGLGLGTPVNTIAEALFAWSASGSVPLRTAARDVAEKLGRCQDSWRRVVALATGLGVPAPGFCCALAYDDTVRRQRLPAALIQGRRDFFGARTYSRVGREGVFHTLWSGDRSEHQAS